MILTRDQWLEKLRQDIKNYLPSKRKDDRQFPGIVIGWAVGFDESHIRWRVWNGLIERENHPDKDCLFGYEPFMDEPGWEEPSGAILIKYPDSMPQEEGAFVAWAHEQSSMALENEFYLP